MLSGLEPRRVALIKPSAMGDVVHTLPVATALRTLYPAAELTWVVNRAYAPLLRGHPDLSGTLEFDRGAFQRGVAGAARYSAKFAAELWGRKFDLVVDLQGLLRTGLMTLATGAPRRVGFRAAREGARYAYTHAVAVPDADRIHAVDRYWRVVEFLGGGGLPKHFRVPIDPAAADWARAELGGLAGPRIAVAVGAKWVTKRWPVGHFAELLKRAAARSGGSLVFVGAAEDSAAAAEVIARVGGETRDYTGRTSIAQLAAVLANVDLMVGNDTGPLHLAAALGRPCVAPYTCTRVALHGPYGSTGGGVATTVACAGSYRKTCPDMICMPDLTPDRLWGRLSEVLDAWAANCRSA